MQSGEYLSPLFRFYRLFSPDAPCLLKTNAFFCIKQIFLQHFYLFLQLFLFSLGYNNAIAQKNLRCTNNEHRAWWDVLHYELHVTFDLEQQQISGYNIITAQALLPKQSVMQIDLQLPMVVDSIKSAGGLLLPDGAAVPFVQEDDICYIMMPFAGFEPGNRFKVKVYFHGQPKIAQRPPWDGGIIMTHDDAGQPWWSVACQGAGASIWWPCKDLRSDEPDEGISEFYEAPSGYTVIGNGRLQETISLQNSTIWYWETLSPINLYNVTFYLGKYTHWQEQYSGKNGMLPIDYYALDTHVDAAKKQWQQTIAILNCYEFWLGAYPFYKDGFKLVHAPFLGMEHQSAIAYGNGFQNGYLGTDRSSTGHGLDFDFIIAHETAHEWFGNSITAADPADDWIHEGFASYAEMLVVECLKGKEAAYSYQSGKKQTIQNDMAVQGRYEECDDGSGDRYDKAGMMIHSIRMMMENDSLFRAMLHALNDSFYCSMVRSTDICNFVNAFSGMNFNPLFDQYLHRTEIPILAWRQITKGKLQYRWMNCVPDFNMPVTIWKNDTPCLLHPVFEWQDFPGKADKESIRLSPDWYVKMLWLE